MKTPNTALAYTIMQNPASSFWLKETISRGLQRDIVDVQNEIEILNNVFMDQAISRATGEAI